MKPIIAFSLLALALSSCTSLKDQTFERISIDDAMLLPTEDKISYYEYFYKTSRHPRDTSNVLAFLNEGDEAAKLVFERMRQKADFYRLVWIIVALDQYGNIDACSPPYSEMLREKVKSLGLNDDVSYITFVNCDLSSLS